MARIRSLKSLEAKARRIRLDQGTNYASSGFRLPTPRNQLGLPTGPSLSSPTISSGSPSAFYRGTTTPAPTPPIPGLAGLAGGAAGGAGAAPGRKPAGTFPSARPPASVDPYAPQTPEQISAQVAAAVKAQTDPVLKQIADQIAARTTAAQQAIIGYTNAFGPALQQLAGIGPAGYQTGIQSQAAIDSALQQSLTGGGTAAASELGAKLAQINAPQADQQAAAQAAIGAGAGNAALATGSASLSALVAQLAGAQNVAAKQPGIAALYGGQATRDLQAQASRDLVDQQGQVTSQIPGLISTLTQNATSDARSQANANRTFNEGVREFGVNRGDRLATARAQTIGNAQTGFFQRDPKTGKWVEVIGPAGTQSRPFTIRPGDTVEIPDGKGGYKAYSAPAAPKDPKSPKTISTPTGTMQWNPKAGAWSTIPGTEPSAKPASVSDAVKTLSVQATTGGLNQKTGEMSPSFRNALRDFLKSRDQDPNSVPARLSPDQVAEVQKVLGISTSASKPQTVDQKLSQSLGYWSDSSGVRVKGVPGKPPPPPGTKRQPINLALSKSVGAWVDATGTPVAGIPGKPPAATGGAKTAKVDLALSKAAGRWVDSSGSRVKAPGLPARPPKPAASFKRLSPADVADSARDAFNGIPDNIVKVVDPATGKVVAKNEPIPQQSYDDAFRDLVLHGADPDMAKKALNRYYKPGQRGRPATTTDYLRDSAIFWQRDNKGNIVAYRRYRNKQTGQERRQAIGIVSPQDPNYKQARAKANAMATS